jgi:hypothetical protein
MKAIVGEVRITIPFVATDEDGAFFIRDFYLGRLRRVSEDGAATLPDHIRHEIDIREVEVKL